MPVRPGLRAALAASLLAACSSTEGADLRIAYLQTGLHGDLALGPSSGGGAARSNDLGDDLGLGDANPSVLLSGVLPTAFGRFGASTFWFDDSGSGVLSADHGDIPAGTTVRSTTDFVNVKTWWAYDLLRTENLRIAPGVAVDFIDMDLDVRSTTSTGFERVELFVPAPLLFVDADARFGRFVFAAQAGGMSIDLNDGGGTYWDFEGRVGYLAREDLELFAGYRFLSIDADGEAGSRDADLDLQVHGWFLGGAYRF